MKFNIIYFVVVFIRNTRRSDYMVRGCRRGGRGRNQGDPHGTDECLENGCGEA